jgi:hypothetical protein
MTMTNWFLGLSALSGQGVGRGVLLLNSYHAVFPFEIIREERWLSMRHKTKWLLFFSASLLGLSNYAYSATPSAEKGPAAPASTKGVQIAQGVRIPGVPETNDLPLPQGHERPTNNEKEPSAAPPNHKGEANVKVFERFTCSGTVGNYAVGDADRSIGGGDDMCYFSSKSPVGQKILRICSVGTKCRVLGTVENNEELGDWSPIITSPSEVSQVAEEPSKAGMHETEATNSFHAIKPEPLQKITNLECVVERETYVDTRDPIYKIAVKLTLDDNLNVQDLKVVHHARSGAQYNRANQYPEAQLSQVPGLTDYNWTGTFAKNPSKVMKGHLLRTPDMRWRYLEQIFKNRRLDYQMESLCHVEAD